MSTHDIICKAIAEQRLLRFRYDGSIRVVEPHIFGSDSSARELLSAYLVRGFTRSGQKPFWRSYVASEMKAIKILDEQFPRPRSGYNPNDKRMRKIYCRVRNLRLVSDL